jgi:hypothetical protein
MLDQPCPSPRCPLHRPLPHRSSRGPAALLSSLVALLFSLSTLASPGAAQAIGFMPFGAGGEGGALNGQTLTFGADGAVHELDAFLFGDAFDPALSFGALAAGGFTALSFGFGAVLSADGSDLLLTYEIANVGASTFTGLSFLSFVDAEIAEATTTYFNELATVVGAPAPGQGFEIDEPGYVFGDLFENLLAGALDGTNAVGPGAPDDVSMALSFVLGDLAPGELARIAISLSEDGDFLGPLALVQQDPLSPDTTLTFSGSSEVIRGQAPIPEPGAALLFTAGALLFAGRIRRVRRPSVAPASLALLGMLLLVPAPAQARLFFVAFDPALQNGTVVPLTGFAAGDQDEHVIAGGVDLHIRTAHPMGFYSSFFPGGPLAFIARSPDPVSVDLSPPVSAIGVQYEGAECFGIVHFEGTAANETFAFQQGDPPTFVGAADIGDITRIVLEDTCYASIFSEIRFMPGSVPPPTQIADLALRKTPDRGAVSQAVGSITWTLDVTNAGPDDSAGARTVDFLPFGVEVVSSNPPHAILAGTDIAQQGIGTLAPGGNFPVTLATDIPPFYFDPSEPTTFSCHSTIENVALTTATSIDPMGADNLSIATVRFDTAARQDVPEICGNNVDDDCDGRNDCSESVCAMHPSCQPPMPFGPAQPFTNCIPPFCSVPFPPPPPPPPPSCQSKDVHGRPIDVPAHCCSLAGPRVNGRAPAECHPPVDPNFKAADPPVDAMGYGYTSAGRLHTYTITYENTGGSNATDVLVIDVLDPDLDDSSLVVFDGGTYDPVERAIVWTDPVVPPAEPHSVGFQVAVRADAPLRSVVRNQATVIFPGATPMERLDTNFVEHVILEPGFVEAGPGVVGCSETAPGSGEWNVVLFNRGNAEMWNTSAEIVDPPASVAVSQGRVSFGAPDDLPGSPDRLSVPLNATPSLGTVAFATQTPGDPCRTLRWRIEWEPAPGEDQVSRDVRVDADADVDGVADTADNCPGDYNPDQQDADGDGQGDACETIASLVPIGDLFARAKSGKVDLVWTPPAGAAHYDVYRGANGAEPGLLAGGHVSEHGVFADFGVSDGVPYSYEIVWHDAAGNESPTSNPVTVTPSARARR